MNYINIIKPGTNIEGKWHKKNYVIKSKLGAGTVGTVYLCEHNQKLVALKISKQDASIMTEVNVLKALKKVQGAHLGPSLLDVDDWITPHGVTYSFYVMEYLRGEGLPHFIKSNGNEWIGVFMLQLLNDLEALHRAGWVFGDLKTDNLIVVSSPPKIRLIDVGGTTQIGRSIKEYTEFYDRGYWEMGTRRAEPSYDLFALVMVVLTIFYPSRFQKSTHPEQTIFQRIDSVRPLDPYSSSLKKAIQGKYKSSKEMKMELTSVLYNRQRRRKQNRQRKSVLYFPVIFESVGILMVAIGYYISALLLF